MADDARWTRFGLRPFRPDGGAPYLERAAGELLARYLDGDQPDPDTPHEVDGGAPPSGSEIEEGRSTVFNLADLAGSPVATPRSTLSLLLRNDQVAGFWIRFGASYVVPEAVDTVQEPGVVAAAVTACRARTWRKTDPTTAAWHAGGWNWDLLLVLEWPSPLLVRGSHELHAELMGTSTPLPVGGSGLSVVRGALRWTNLIDRAAVSPLAPAAVADAIGAVLRSRMARVAEKDTAPSPAQLKAPPPPAPKLDRITPPSVADVPPVVDLVDPDGPTLQFGLPDEEEAPAPDPFGESDPAEPDDLPSILELAAMDEDLADAGGAPWDSWLDELYSSLATVGESRVRDRRPIAGLVELGAGWASAPGRLLSGWVTEDLRISAWSGTRDLDVRSSVRAETARNLSGWVGSAALLLAGWLLVKVLALLLALPFPTTAASTTPVQIPIVSFCSESNPAFLEALSCWTERLASGEIAAPGGACDPANPLGGLSGRDDRLSPLDPTDVRASYCGLLDRGPTGRSSAEEALAAACFQVLGDPDRYAIGGDGTRSGEHGADIEAFFFNPDLRISELAALGDSLAKDCDRCERTARGRIRRLAVRTWIGKGLFAPLALNDLGPSELDVCPLPHRAWGIEDGPGEDLFRYDIYSSARFGRLAREAAALAELGPPSPDDPWSCYMGTLDATERPTLTSGVPGLQLRSPGALDATGSRALVSQLGVHGLLAADPAVIGRGDRAHAACARVVREELVHAQSIHPLHDEGEADPLALCGQVCAGYFGLAPTATGWVTQPEDLKLCTAGAVGGGGADRLCRDSTLPAPRTDAERLARRRCLPSAKYPTPLCRDALVKRTDTLRPDWEGGLLTCGDDVVASDPSLEPDDGGLRRGGVGGVLYESEEVVAAPVDHALPQMVSACAMRLLEQDLSGAGVPSMLPENIAPDQISKTLEATAGRLAGTRVEQRSRRVCEESGAFCYLAAALMVRRPDLLWSRASVLAGADTAEALAVAMGPTLERNYRSQCDDGEADNLLLSEARATCTGGWLDPDQAGTCSAICSSGAFGFRLAARHADAEMRLNAAFRLATATHMCVGLADFASGLSSGDLSWETACLDGLESRAAVALSLITEGGR